MNNAVLITGGAGYIGANVNLRLKGLGYNTIILDDLSSGEEGWVKDENFVNLDITDRGAVADYFKSNGEKIDSVVHLAAKSIVAESTDNPGEYYRVNLEGTLNILDGMQNAGIAKVVYGSSCAVYGMINQAPIPENYRTMPHNPYGHSTLMTEQIIKDYAARYNMNFIILRMFNVAGGNVEAGLFENHNPETHLIPAILKKAKAGETKVDVFGADYSTTDGSAVRDYVHVTDVARAFAKSLKMMNNQSRVREEFNIGNAKGYSVFEVIRTAAEITGVQLEPVIHPARKGDTPIMTGASTKTTEMLGWLPQYSTLTEIIKSQWQAMNKQ